MRGLTGGGVVDGLRIEGVDGAGDAIESTGAKQLLRGVARFTDFASSALLA